MVPPENQLPAPLERRPPPPAERLLERTSR
jgi:hypothetical protein